MRLMRAERLVAVQGSGQVLADGGGRVKWLGNVLWFTLTEVRIDREALRRLLLESGLGEDFLPKPINHRDAFRKACAAAERQRVELEDGNIENVNVVEIGTSTKDRLVYGVVREIKNPAGERLRYEVVAKAVLEGSAKAQDPVARIEVEPGVILGEVEQGVTQAIMAGYEDLRTNYTRRNMAELVDRVLATCSPVSLRPTGGVYFTPREVTRGGQRVNIEARVKALQRFVRGLRDYSTTGNNPTLWMIPVIDGDEHAEMLQESLQEQIRNQAMALVEEMKGKLAAGAKITEAQATKWIDRCKALAAQVEEYRSLIEGLKLEAEADIAAARQVALKMLEQVQ